MREVQRLTYEAVPPRKGYFEARSTSLFAEVVDVLRFLERGVWQALRVLDRLH